MAYFTFIIAVAIGLGCFWVSLKLIRLFFKVKKWDKIDARILTKEIFLRPNYSYSRTPYGINLEYEFSRNGQRYTGNKLTLPELLGGQINYMKKNAERTINKIEPTMLVHVNPDNPNESVLYCKGIGFYIVVFCMGILSLLMGLNALISN